MTEPHPDFDSELVDLTGIDLADLADMEGSVLKESLDRLEDEAAQGHQATAGFSASI